MSNLRLTVSLYRKRVTTMVLSLQSRIFGVYLNFICFCMCVCECVFLRLFTCGVLFFSRLWAHLIAFRGWKFQSFQVFSFIHSVGRIHIDDSTHLHVSAVMISNFCHKYSNGHFQAKLAIVQILNAIWHHSRYYLPKLMELKFPTKRIYLLWNRRMYILLMCSASRMENTSFQVLAIVVSFL